MIDDSGDGRINYHEFEANLDNIAKIGAKIPNPK
jgi:hypothetical protein